MTGKCIIFKMNHKLFVMFCCIKYILVVVILTTGILSLAQDKYKLVWSDEFNKDGGNPSNTSFPRRMEVDWVRVWQKY